MAIISGGSARSASPNNVINLDAVTGSYDPDDKLVTLGFSWSCKGGNHGQLQPESHFTRDECPTTLQFVYSTNAGTLTVPSPC